MSIPQLADVCHLDMTESPDSNAFYRPSSKAVYRHLPAGTSYPLPSVSPNLTAHSLSVTMMSRLMLNLHSTATSGIFSTFPTSDSSTGVAFTSRVPDPNLDSPFGTNSSGTDFEMEGKTPIESLHARTELIVR